MIKGEDIVHGEWVIHQFRHHRSYYCYSYPSKAMDPTYPLVTIANVLACFLLTLSISTRFRSVPVTVFQVWVLLMCLIRAVDSIIWSNNVRDIIPVWCTISQVASPNTIDIN